ncbi:bacterial regulatory proteins, tetR family [bacterium BMS3Bbin04]|nr:bacterial regulatory proteins, tetR family [bacterium BMS3Bbin04]
MAGDVKTELERRQQIFAAAEPIFIRFGYRKTTVEEICKATRISKRTFYNLFTDKFDLLMRMHAQLAQDLTDRVRASIPDNASGAVGIYTYLDLFFEVTEERPLFRVLLEEGDLMKQMTEIAPTDEQFSSVLVLLTEIVQSGIDSGEFRQMDAWTVTWVIQTMLDSIHVFMMGNPAASQAIDIDQFIEEMKMFIVNGLLAKQD